MLSSWASSWPAPPEPNSYRTAVLAALLLANYSEFSLIIAAMGVDVVVHLQDGAGESLAERTLIKHARTKEQ